ncbi:class A beta-lactamase [Polycladidibacter stylochi]|uniref:class A beta-lactamase n=1 Tax=Polycladidibacter stylochi TaxID=1807766 RepID=UPI00082B0C2F|nr:class A beta-lactamase [Pseudovibrio stylochi]
MFSENFRLPNVPGRIVSAIILVGCLSNTSHANELLDTVRKLENEIGGRIGVTLQHPKSAWSIDYRSNERFPLSSTFKPLVCGAILARVDRHEDSLEKIITYKKEQLVAYSPVTKENVSSGMSIGQLCEATITLSDNSAGNFLLKHIGGPEKLTAFLRGIGDARTRLDRWETKLNEGKPKDPRDTTTPNSIARTLNKLLLTDVLKPKSRQQLKQWMLDDKVADALIRKHLPTGWRIADKTGAGGYGSRGIIAAIWPKAAEPYFTAIYMTGSNADIKQRNAVIAEIGRSIILEIENHEKAKKTNNALR